MVISPVVKGIIGVGLAGAGIVGTSLMLTKSRENKSEYERVRETCSKGESLAMDIEHGEQVGRWTCYSSSD